MEQKTQSRPPSTVEATAPVAQTQVAASVEVTAPRAPVLTVDHRLLAVGEAVIRWEKLRLVYNGVLAIWTLLLLVVSLVANPGNSIALLDVVLAGAIFANLCYCLGPVTEAWAAYLFGTNRVFTGVVFAAGTLFTMLLATVALVGL